MESFKKIFRLNSFSYVCLLEDSLVVYRFVSSVKKVSSKGNSYIRVVFVDLNGVVNESFVFDSLLARLESLNLSFGDYVDIECDLKGIVNIESYEGMN